MDTPKDVNEMLDLIDRFLITQPEQAPLLWNVLSALRGPDIARHSMVKEHFTVPVRRAAFPQVAMRNTAIPATFYQSHGTYIPTYIETVFHLEVAVGKHFAAHISNAIRSLKLIDRWPSSTDKEKKP